MRRYAMLILMGVLAHSGAFAQISIENAFPNLGFNRPVDIQNAGDGSDRLFVVEQAGRILVFPNDPGASNAEVFLDIRGKVLSGGNEEGLLGLVFHPDYASNGYFYVNHSASSPRRNVIARYTVSGSDPNTADPASEVVIMEFLQPYGNHNGGQIAFGPDGYLYIATGDGGSGGDPQDNGQNLETVLGAILRIDVDNQDDGLNYAIPEDNPWAGNADGYREEIWAYGLRNPWRFSFDPVTGWLWTGDVGQSKYEEIDIIEKGGNYGWNTMEGFHCYDPPSGCDQTGLELPVVEYGRNLGVSVTGGHVYRGSAAPELEGLYLYADFGTGRIWTIDYNGVDDPVNELLENTGQNVSTFGVDESGELYFATFGGSIYMFKSNTTGIGERLPAPGLLHIDALYPNPVAAGASTTLSIDLRTAPGSPLTVQVYDMLGRIRFSGSYESRSRTLPVSLGAVPPGTYNVILRSADGAQGSKIFQVL